MTPRRRDPQKALARRAKRAGISKADYLRARRAVVNKAAARDGWRPSERAATLSNIELIAEEVWTEIKCKFKKVRGSENYRVQMDGHTFIARPYRFGLRIDRDSVHVAWADDLAAAQLWLNSPRALTAGSLSGITNK